MNRIAELHQLGQSLWYDNIQRRLLEDGTMSNLIQNEDILGMTSNPTIFNNAIGKSTDYDSSLQPMAWAGWKPEDIFFQLAIEDIQTATDLFAQQYEKSNHLNGYVSLEVSPYLANDTKKTFDQAKKLWKQVNRPNLMVKIPATKAGIPAIKKAIAEGINVNVTLIFSLERYHEVIYAFIEGIEERVNAGKPINNIASVASFFISRFDSKIDAQLQKIALQNKDKSDSAAQMMGKAAIANAQMAYKLFQDEFYSERFKALEKHGARVQRPLWASTSTKNPQYRDVIYIEDLIAPDTVNTVPPQTLNSFRDHGNARITITKSAMEQSLITIEDLRKLGINIDEVSETLEMEGVKSFSEAYTDLLNTIKTRCKQFKKELGSLANKIPQAVDALDDKQYSKRIVEKDPTLWTASASAHTEIANWLGWIAAPTNGKLLVAEINQFTRVCMDAGYKKALLIGMGGSSLAPEVLSLTLGSLDKSNPNGLELMIIDSTDPLQLKAALKWVEIPKTLFIVSSKSGSTAEISALFEIFWEKAVKKLGKRECPRHFIAITDPGSSLELKAKDLGFRKIFNADPSVGGRYSALIAFGLVPAALMGINLNMLLGKAQHMEMQCAPSVSAGRNPGLVLGAVIGEAANSGIDKLTIITDPGINSFGSWMEQLIAESSGKDNKGIVPVDIEPFGKVKGFGKDRLFVYLRLDGSHDKHVKSLLRAHFPVITLNWSTTFDLFSQFYLWEYATAVACAVIGVNAFDQPAVQDNKTRAANKITDFQKSGRLDEGIPLLSVDGAQIFGQPFPGYQKAGNINQVIAAFLEQLKEGDYIAINAYLPRNEKTQRKLQSFRKKILNKYGKATTLGFGPRYLHSTGQLHKGGGDNSVFIQITSDYKEDYPIPTQGLSIGVLERAQALGDFESLQTRKRRAIRINLSDLSELNTL